MQHKFMAFATVASLGLFLSACSDEDEVLTQNATSSGTVSGFGSVYVNGLRYVTENSNILSNGVESDEAALKVGMKVVVNAHQSSATEGTAFEVKYLADAIGKIDAIDLAAPSISVLGQTYLITSATKFEDVPFHQLTIDMGVELSAIENQAGSFVLGYLDTKDNISDYQLSGTVSKLNKVDRTFSIGKLLVNYDDFEGFSNGPKVVVKSNRDPIYNEQAAVELIADEVNVQGLQLVVGGTLTYSGFVEDIVEDIDEDEAGTTIELGGRKYLLTDTTVFSQGSADDLDVGSQVSLVATVIEGESEFVSPSYPVNSIRIELANEISLEGIVQSVTDTSFTLFGQEFTVDNYTQYEDDSEQELRYFTFSDIAIGDRLDIDAYELNDALISRKVEREETGASEQDAYEIEGVVDSFDTPSFSVKGISILTDDQTQFENAKGKWINQETFFQTLAEANELDIEVEVETYYTVGGVLVALEVEIDGEEKDSEVELSGTIDNLISVINVKSFTVNGHQVLTTMETEFENGDECHLADEKFISVEGEINTQGLLVAEEINFIQEQKECPIK